ncbi:MAG: GTP 3',8-cyclase MoaA [Desulfotomaculaceae bacterium]|nr:GTP 3',8-cyclase MoaA [Desulfotomaculaceae bacterium]MDD4767726.1 GTP 3',8-cyclase MoaA [Desulfotomaculaceae bacterium]
MRDAYRREINYLRVSVTDRCNLRCVYCMPPEGVEFLPHDEILRVEEIEAIIRAAASVGIRKIRLTGGEPLVRKGIKDLVRRISNIPGIDDITMTTNGILLPFHAATLKKAGLKRVNISLDTLKNERYREITRGGKLASVWKGIQAALDAGLHPVKINTVITRGVNDNEVEDLARLSLKMPLHIRFIEIMPIGDGNAWAGGLVPASEIMEKINRGIGRLDPVDAIEGDGPARYYRIAGAEGTVGFITAMSDHFCETCNRLRLTSSGGLRPCLYDSREIDLKTPLRRGAGEKELVDLIMDAIDMKPDRHHMHEGWTDRKRVMSQIGG